MPSVQWPRQPTSCSRPCDVCLSLSVSRLHFSHLSIESTEQMLLWADIFLSVFRVVSTTLCPEIGETAQDKDQNVSSRLCALKAPNQAVRAKMHPESSAVI